MRTTFSHAFPSIICNVKIAVQKMPLVFFQSTALSVLSQSLPLLISYLNVLGPHVTSIVTCFSGSMTMFNVSPSVMSCSCRVLSSGRISCPLRTLTAPVIFLVFVNLSLRVELETYMQMFRQQIPFCWTTLQPKKPGHLSQNRQI